MPPPCTPGTPAPVLPLVALDLDTSFLDANFDLRSTHRGGTRYINRAPRLASPCYLLAASAGGGALEWRVDGVWRGVHAIELQFYEPVVAQRARLRLVDARARAFVDVDATLVSACDV